MSENNPRPGVKTLLEFEGILDRFEAAWRAGQRPDLNEFVSSVPEASRPTLFSELLLVELACRREAKETPQASDYVDKFPQFAVQVQQCVVATEAAQRRAAGALKIRCPHCHNPIEVVNDDPSGDVSCPSCGSSFNLAKDLKTGRYLDAGRKVGHFQLLDRLGQGAFGEVWKARDTELDRIVAIKIPRREHLTEQEIEQFLREARTAAQVRHPNIVSVYEVGREHGVIYIASDFIDGATLDQWVQAHPLTVEESVELCAKIAEALHHAHEAGVVHRDLKPQNILVTLARRASEGSSALATSDLAQSSDPSLARRASVPESSPTLDPQSLTPFITDFGLAKRDAGEITMTVEGAILGTPAYMSPEQARGEAHHADRRSDVYSLGVILFRLLTGELPFRGKSQMLIQQILNEEPPALRKLDARLPRDVETICLKCLEKDPTRRYQSAAALAADLHRWLTGHPIEARPVSRTERAWRWCRRNPAVASLSAAVVLVLLTGVTVSSFFAFKAETRSRVAIVEGKRAIAAQTKAELAVLAEKQAKQEEAKQRILAVANADAEKEQRLLAEKETKRANDEADRGRRQLYLARMNLAQVAWDGARISETTRLLHFYHPKSDDSTLRGFEWFYWDAVCHSDIMTLKWRPPGYDVSVTFSADGKRLAASNIYGTVTVLDAVSGQQTLTLRVRGGKLAGRGVAFSADGNRLASASIDNTVKVWDTTSGQETLTLNGHTSEVRSVAFSADGKWLASASNDNTVKVWDTTSGQETLTLNGHTSEVRSVAFSADWKWLASASNDNTVRVWDTTSGQETLTLNGHTSEVRSVAFSADGKWLASASNDNTVKVWDTTSGQETLTLNGHTGPVSSVAFSPDGKRLASASYDRTVKVWDATSGHELLTLKGHSKTVLSIAYSPDGRRLASVSIGRIGAVMPGEVKIWDATGGQEPLTLKAGMVSSMAFSPDGKRLLSASHDKTVKVWDTMSGQETLTLQRHTGLVTSVAYSPDGKQLVSASFDYRSKLGELKVWDASSGQEIFALNGHTVAVQSVAFSPDGKRLAFASNDKTVNVWDTMSGQETLTLKGNADAVTGVAFSADGKRLMSASNNNAVKVWDATSGQEMLRAKDYGADRWSAVFSAFSPDGKRLASVPTIGTNTGTVMILDATNGRETFILQGHADAVISVVFSPDGKRLASASLDQTVKVWDTMSGQETLTLKGHTGAVLSVAFSADGRRLASASSDGLIKVWDARPWTPELRAEREALSLVHFLRDQGQPQSEWLNAISSDQTLSEPVRHRALQFAREWKP